jgi:hypothetical protein
MTTQIDDEMPPAQRAAHDAFWGAALESGVDCPRLARAMLSRDVFPVTRAALEELATPVVAAEILAQLRREGSEVVTPEEIAAIRQTIADLVGRIEDNAPTELAELPTWARP